jgi:acyl-CoA reductase-like NAD-dependent aldehyde dehydrogenase
MDTIASKDTPSTITTHYIDGAFIESHGREVMDIISPTSGKAIGRVTLADEEDTRRAIAAARRATAGRRKKSAWSFWAAYMRPLRHAPTI